MTDCAKCGHELGIGRYCTNCGHPVDVPASEDPAPDWRTDTAERATPLVPAAPPPAWTPPPAPRFPLFADEVDDADAPEAYQPSQTSHRRSLPWGGWVAAAVVVTLLAVVGVWYLSSDDEEPPAARPTPSAPASGDEEPPSDEPSGEAPSGVTAESSVTVPATAAAGRDVEGNPVDYEGANLLDGVPETCWRMPGDGTGEEIVITLPEETRLRSVGMINGYAKQAPDRDWYHGNRRVEQVEWVFDDGTTVPQTLEDTVAVQSVDVDVATTTITLRLVSVSKPGTGPSRRDFTAISDLVLVAG